MDELGSRQIRAEDLLREVEAVLMRRVEHVEKENQKLRRYLTYLGAGLAALAIAGVILFALAFSGGGGVAETVEAERFVLRDASGIARGVFEIGNEGGARLVLRDADARDRLRLALLQDGSPGVTFADREGRPRAVLGVLPDETATLVFADAQGQTRAVLSLLSDESSTLVFADRSGVTRAGMGVNSAGDPNVTVFERQSGAADPPAADTALVLPVPPPQ